MKTCPACSHNRLVHDSWGCKTGCGCGVSIIYLTPNLLAGTANKVKEQEFIDHGNSLDSDVDKVEEYRVRMMARRAVVEQRS